MAKNKQTPGIALTALLEKHNLNYNRLAKAIGLSSAMVRLIARDENPVSASVAFRLAKFFKTKPEYWLALQLDFDNAKAAEDKKLAKALKDIPTVDKATFERKPRTPKAAQSVKKGKAVAAKKPAAKSAAKPAAKKPAAKVQAKGKAAAAKKTAPKAVKKAPAKAAPAKKARPVVVKAKPQPKPVAVQQPVTPPPPAASSEGTINEPQI